MAMYKTTITVYKGPTGKTLKGPTALHFVGNLCSAFGLIGLLGAILCLMDHYPAAALISAIVTAVVGFTLGVVLCKKAKGNAEEAFLKALAEMEQQTSER